VQRNQEPVTVERVLATHRARRKEIRKRLGEFEEVWRKGSDARLWEELAYCIFTAGASARMGLSSVDAVRPLLMEGDSDSMLSFETPLINTEDADIPICVANADEAIAIIQRHRQVCGFSGSSH
jgi:hypothetical protein